MGVESEPQVLVVDDARTVADTLAQILNLNGFRAVRRDAALRVNLKENTHTIEQEMVMKILRHGMRVVNAPTHEYKRRFGESHIRIWREWPRFVWCVVENIVAPDVAAPAVVAESPAQVAAGLAE